MKRSIIVMVWITAVMLTGCQTMNPETGEVEKNGKGIAQETVSALSTGGPAINCIDDVYFDSKTSSYRGHLKNLDPSQYNVTAYQSGEWWYYNQLWWDNMVRPVINDLSFDCDTAGKRSAGIFFVIPKSYYPPAVDRELNNVYDNAAAWVNFYDDYGVYTGEISRHYFRTSGLSLINISDSESINYSTCGGVCLRNYTISNGATINITVYGGTGYGITIDSEFSVELGSSVCLVI